jgi:hypothetical protein
MRHEVVESNFRGRWQTPVWVRVGYGRAEPVWGPKQALDCLSYRWPAVQGRHYRGAKANCIAAVRKQLASELAREAFIRASIEAAMLNGESVDPISPR